MLTLGIETATDVCSVALLDGERLLVASAVDVPRSHATRLAPLIAEALAHAGRSPRDLRLVAVSAGPGSYTGLRIGASTARGLCLATGAEMAAVGTLDALAAEAALRAPGSTVLVALPSRRGEVVLALAGADGARVVPPEAVLLADLPERLAGVCPPGPLAVAGPAAGAVVEALAGDPVWAARGVRRLDIRPTAERVARMALSDEGLRADPEAFEPAYVGTFATPPPAAVRADTILRGSGL